MRSLMSSRRLSSRVTSLLLVLVSIQCLIVGMIFLGVLSAVEEKMRRLHDLETGRELSASITRTAMSVSSERRIVLTLLDKNAASPDDRDELSLERARSAVSMAGIFSHDRPETDDLANRYRILRNARDRTDEALDKEHDARGTSAKEQWIAATGAFLAEAERVLERISFFPGDETGRFVSSTILCLRILRFRVALENTAGSFVRLLHRNGPHDPGEVLETRRLKEREASLFADVRGLVALTGPVTLRNNTESVDAYHRARLTPLMEHILRTSAHGVSTEEYLQALSPMLRSTGTLFLHADVAAGAHLKELRTLLEKRTNHEILYFSAVVLLALLMCFLLVFRVSRPLARIHGIVRDLEAGNTDAPFPTLKYGDEFGALSETLERFRRTLRNQDALNKTLREREQWIRLITDSVPARIAYIDSDIRYQYINRTYAEAYGIAQDSLVGVPLREFAGDDVMAKIDRYIKRALAGEVVRFTEVFPTKPEPSSSEVAYVPRRDESGRVIGFFTLTIDVTDRERAIAALKASEERLSLAIEATSDGLFDWDLRDDTIFYSPRWFTMLGYVPGTMPYCLSTWEDLVHPDDLPAAMEKQRRSIAGFEPYVAEFRMRTFDGDWKWILSRARIVARDENGKATRIVGTHVDITERKNLERRLSELATSDELTGLSNRRHFLETGAREVERSRRNGSPLAFLMLDLDNFKDVNDRYGHPTGDAALRLFADTGAKTLRVTDIFGRLGGEEFAILLPDTPEEGAQALAQRLRRDVEKTAFPSDEGTFSVTVSIGISSMTDPEDSLNDLMHRADRALYESKRAGRNRVTVA